MLRKRLNRRFGLVSYYTHKAFGIWAWICMTLDKAKESLDSVAGQVPGKPFLSTDWAKLNRDPQKAPLLHSVRDNAEALGLLKKAS